MKNRIRDLREDADLTQKQVAQYLQMSQTGYSKYETGEICDRQKTEADGS